MQRGAFEQWTGQPSRNAGNQYTQVKAPEWAYCSADCFIWLLEEAEANKTTLIEMQGGWDYPVEERIKIQ